VKKSMVLLTVAICTIIIAVTVFQGIIPVKYEIEAGSTAPGDIYATREVVDTVTTEKLRKTAEEEVTRQFVIDNDITLHADRDLANIFLEITKDRQGQNSAFRSNYCLELTEAEYKKFRETITEVQQDIMNRGVTNVEEAVVAAGESIRVRTYDEAAAAAGMDILKKTIAVNKEESGEKTQEEIKRARDAVKDVVYKENQIIVRKGDIVSEAQFAVLSSLGLVKGKETLKIFQLLGVLLFLVAGIGVLHLYLRAEKKEGRLPQNYPVIVSTIMAATIVMTYANKGQMINMYTIPIGAGGILLSVLIGKKPAIFIHTITASVAAIVMGGNVYYLAAILLSGYLSIFMFSNVSQRSRLVLVSGRCILINAAVFLSLGLLQGLSFIEAVKIGGYGIINSALSAVILMGFLPFLETLFDIATPFRLLELSNPDHPLLSRLLKEAPGTYHHSLMVGNLAEAACEEIGANGLLARVGAYYHDAGKLKSPDMFTENQYGANPHDRMDPKESAKIIIAHVRDGLSLLQEYKLPKVIKNITACHHGASAAMFFLYKARQLDETADDKPFRYPGPIPKTKEESVVMMADSVEAAVRSLDDKSEKSIKGMIEKIIDGKISDGQMTDCPLTFSEIQKISAAFLKVFGGYFHSRIKYPDKDTKE